MHEGDPEYCAHCGGRLESLSRGVEFRCRECDRPAFRNPSPNARVAVVDRGEATADAENRLLLVEIDDSGRLGEPPYHDSEWMLPGGHPELHEQPPVAAARELEEETGLAVDPTDLVLFAAVTRWVVPGNRGLVVFYAVDRRTTAGSLTGADDASDAQFWGPVELATAEGRAFRELHEEPDAYATPGRIIDAATAALDGEKPPTQSDVGGS